MATVQERTGRTLAQPVPTTAPGATPERPPARQPWRRRLLLGGRMLYGWHGRTAL